MTLNKAKFIVDVLTSFDKGTGNVAKEQDIIAENLVEIATKDVIRPTNISEYDAIILAKATWLKNYLEQK